jgi:hypothetical protein
MRLVRLALLGALVAAASACTSKGGAGFFIVQNQVPDEDCVIPSDVASPFMSRGSVEVGLASGYFFTPVAQSLFQTSETGDVDHVIFVQGADVSISFPGGELDDFDTVRQMFSGSIFPGGTTSFGFQILTRDDLDAIAPVVPNDPSHPVAVRVEIAMFGTADGEDVDAEPYFYNVDVCNGCVAYDLGPCEEIPEGTVIRQGGTCDIFQDAAVDCCVDASERLICPAQPPAV